MKEYHYTDSGLDSVYLVNGYEFVKSPRGEGIRIRNVDGLHRAIGMTLVKLSRPLAGQEIRFLRKEMLMSQQMLGDLLDVRELTVARWEKDQTPVPRAADAALRKLYEGCADTRDTSLMKLLRQIADNEDKAAQRIEMKRSDRGRWSSADVH